MGRLGSGRAREDARRAKKEGKDAVGNNKLRFMTLGGARYVIHFTSSPGAVRGSTGDTAQPSTFSMVRKTQRQDGTRLPADGCTRTMANHFVS